MSRGDVHDDVSEKCFWLVGVDGTTAHVRVPITTPVLVGRASDNHVVLDEARLSRQHSRFAPEADGCVVYDLNSVNGTFVNEVRVTRRVLASDDIVRVGQFSFRVELAEAPSERRVPRIEAPTMRGLEVARAPESVPARMLSSAPGRDSAARLPGLDLDQLEDAYEKLGTLYAFMQAIGKTTSRRELLEVMGTKIRAVYDASTTVRIYLRSGRGTRELSLAHEVSDGSSRTSPPDLPEELRASVLETGLAILTQSADVIGGTDMYAPIIGRGDVLGVIHVSAGDATFTRADLDLLNGMASPAAIMLQNTTMHEQTIAQDRLHHDLNLAAQIQKSFLPREVISVEGLELFAEYRAAYTVGGDFYDVFWVTPERLAVFIGDISGKGVSAALLMARISGELRVAALAHIDPAKVLSTMNRATLDRNQPELFFTAIYFTVDVKTGDVLLASAGHCPPYLVKASGGLEPVTAGAGVPVGILEDATFEATMFRISPGDTLVLYTDGVVEATNASGALYGSSRLEVALAHAGVRPEVIADEIIESVRQHSVNGPPNDDLTLLVCHRSLEKGVTLQPRRRSSQLPPVRAPSDPVDRPPPSSSG